MQILGETQVKQVVYQLLMLVSDTIYYGISYTYWEFASKKMEARFAYGSRKKVSYICSQKSAAIFPLWFHHRKQQQQLLHMLYAKFVCMTGYSLLPDLRSGTRY